MSEVITFFRESIYSAVTSVFGIFFDFAYSFVIVVYDFFCNLIKKNDFSGVGEDFFNNIANSVNGLSFNYNFIFWAVGILIVFYILKTFVIPLIIKQIGYLIELITPLI